MEAGKSATDEVLRGLHETGAYSDLTVICGDKTFNVHKAIVCSRSQYFAKACEEGRWKEGLDNVIDLEAAGGECDDDDIGKDDPEAVRCMFEYIYLHAYDISGNMSQKSSAPVENGLCLHAKVYALGDKYEIASLKQAALQQFLDKASVAWNDASFPEAVKITFTTTPDNDKALRDTVTDIIHKNAKELAGNPKIEAVIRKLDGLAYLLWQSSLSTPGTECGVCGTAFVTQCEECRRHGFRSGTSQYVVCCHCGPEHPRCVSHTYNYT